MNRHHQINYIEFNVHDIDEAIAFFSAAFGWTFTPYGPAYAGIQGPDGEVGGLAQSDEVKVGGPLVILYSDDLDATRDAVIAAGGLIVQEPYDFPGGRRFHFEGPSGHELAVWSEA